MGCGCQCVSRLRDLALRPRHHAGQKLGGGGRETRQRISSYSIHLLLHLNPIQYTVPLCNSSVPCSSVSLRSSVLGSRSHHHYYCQLSHNDSSAATASTFHTHAWSLSPHVDTIVHHVHLRSRQHRHAQHSLAQPAHLGRYHQDPGAHQL